MFQEQVREAACDVDVNLLLKIAVASDRRFLNDVEENAKEKDRLMQQLEINISDILFQI